MILIPPNDHTVSQYIEDQLDMAMMDKTKLKKLKDDMDSRVVKLINDYELATGRTVVDFKISRVCDLDWRSAVISAKPFVFFSVPNRKVGGSDQR